MFSPNLLQKFNVDPPNLTTAVGKPPARRANLTRMYLTMQPRSSAGSASARSSPCRGSVRRREEVPCVGPYLARPADEAPAGFRFIDLFAGIGRL